MPLPIAHGLLGATITAALHPQPRNNYYGPLLLGALVAIAADFDFLLVLISGSKTWHRGFSHSIAFAFGLSLVAVFAIGWRHVRAISVYAMAFASHGLLDYLTTKNGSGVELLWPFSSQRVELGIIGLSEVPSKLPPVGILRALALELMIFVLPFMLAIFFRRTKRH